MSAALYRHGAKGSWKLLAICVAVLTIYITVIVSLFNPSAMAALETFYDVMPELMTMVGMAQTAPTLTAFITSYLYGMLMLVFPMIFTIATANRLVAALVDKGAMSWLLAAPVKRRRVALTQLAVLASGITLMMLYSTLLCLICCQASLPGQLDIAGFIVLNIGTWVLQLFIGGICFFFSCLFGDSRRSLAFGAGIPVGCYVLQMLVNYGGSAANLKYITFFTLFDENGLVQGSAAAYAGVAVLAAGALALYIAAVQVFCKKDLHI